MLWCTPFSLKKPENISVHDIVVKHLCQKKSYQTSQIFLAYKDDKF